MTYAFECKDDLGLSIDSVRKSLADSLTSVTVTAVSEKDVVSSYLIRGGNIGKGVRTLPLCVLNVGRAVLQYLFFVNTSSI